MSFLSGCGDDEIGTTRPLLKTLLPIRYGQEATTPLTIEVLTSPPATVYNLDVSN
jgi:hypothetical protein